MKPTLLILAAGRGSRFGGAKQVTPMGPNHETIMEYSIYDALEAGFGDVVLVINESVAQDTMDLVEKITSAKDKISYAYQDLHTEKIPQELLDKRSKPWGTAHAIMSASQFIKGNFAMINADDYYGKEAFVTMADFLSNHTSPSQYSMVGYELKNTLSQNGTVSRGISISNLEGLLTSIHETHGIHEKDGKIIADHPNGGNQEITKGLASMNFWGFQNNIFDELDKQFEDFLSNSSDLSKDEYTIPSVIDRMIKEEKIEVSVLKCSAQWFGVTYKEDQTYASESIRSFVEEGKYTSPLWD